MIYLELLVSFLYIGVLAIGGGYAALPLIQTQCVEFRGWLTMSEFTDLLTISQITPGPIAINSATFVGMKVAGFPGALVATLGFVLPPFLIVSLLWVLYKKYRSLTVMQGILSGLRPAVVALIASAGVSVIVQALWGEAAISLSGTDWLSGVLLLAGFVVLRKWKTDPIFVILGCGALGLLAEVLQNLIS